MWTCPKCGEQHGDQFAECWKCVGAEMQTAITAAPTAPIQAERKLRPFGYFFARAIGAFAVGASLTMLFANVVNLRMLHDSLNELSLAGTSLLSVVVGFACAALVGLFVWVVFPYEPSAEPGNIAENRTS